MDEQLELNESIEDIMQAALTELFPRPMDATPGSTEQDASSESMQSTSTRSMDATETSPAEGGFTDDNVYPIMLSFEDSIFGQVLGSFLPPNAHNPEPNHPDSSTQTQTQTQTQVLGELLHIPDFEHKPVISRQRLGPMFVINVPKSPGLKPAQTQLFSTAVYVEDTRTGSVLRSDEIVGVEHDKDLTYLSHFRPKVRQTADEFVFDFSRMRINRPSPNLIRIIFEVYQDTTLVKSVFTTPLRVCAQSKHATRQQGCSVWDSISSVEGRMLEDSILREVNHFMASDSLVTRPLDMDDLRDLNTLHSNASVRSMTSYDLNDIQRKHFLRLWMKITTLKKLFVAEPVLAKLWNDGYIQSIHEKTNPAAPNFPQHMSPFLSSSSSSASSSASSSHKMRSKRHGRKVDAPVPPPLSSVHPTRYYALYLRFEKEHLNVVVVDSAGITSSILATLSRSKTICDKLREILETNSTYSLLAKDGRQRTLQEIKDDF